MLIFPGPPGVVAVMNDPAVQGVLPLTSLTGQSALSYNAQRSIITRLMVSERTNQQFQQTLGGEIYIYVFGDQVGQVVISGLSMAADCSGDNQFGAEMVMQWYRQNKVSNNQNALTIMLGSTSITGFLTGFTADVVDPKLRLMSYSLELNTVSAPPLQT